MIKRKPILLNSNTVALLNIIHSPHHVDDVWLEVMTEKLQLDNEIFNKSAREFIDQLEDHWAPAFLMELIKECFKELRGDGSSHQIGWCKEVLKNLNNILDDSKTETTGSNI